MTLGITSENLGDGVHVIGLSGEVDLYSAPGFKDELLAAIAMGAHEVVVDLTETTFIDSTALGVLLRGVKRLSPREGRLSVVCADDSITKIFTITGLDRVFPLYPSRSAALASISVA